MSILEALTRVFKMQTTLREWTLTKDLLYFCFRGSFNPLIFLAANLIMGNGYTTDIHMLGITILLFPSLEFALGQR